jgi:16S rRNA (cytosine967-C5)-methyltransferase
MSNQRNSRWAPGATALADAARAVSAIAFEGRAADVALEPFSKVPHRAAVRAITLGCARWYLRLAPAIYKLLQRPEGVAPEIRALLIATAHQIEYSRNPAESNANAAVDATRLLGRQRVSGLVNAVLRRFVAERVALLAQVDAALAARTAHPDWLVGELRSAWPQRAEALLEANNGHPPMTLRVNLARLARADYLQKLTEAGIAAEATPWLASALVLARPFAVSALPGFKEGLVSVQDAGAQLAAELLDAQPGMRVLDACAAPGGKTCHVLERAPGLSGLLAVDLDATRVSRIRDNLDRLGLDAQLATVDARRVADYWDGTPFDRILLDAPCSSTGVIRRHPDIKLLRRRSDIAPFSTMQLQMLEACFSMLRAGGRLLYATCSLLPAENEEVLSAFLETEPRARAVSPEGRAPGAVLQRHGFYLFPGESAGTDGFYYACVEKTTSEPPAGN